MSGGSCVSPIIREPIEILLVQENADDVRLTRDALQQARVRNNLRVVSNGEEALRLLRPRRAQPLAPRPHLILLDPHQPTGLTVVSEIRSDESLKQIPVVLLTISPATSGLLGQHVKAAGYMTTPFGVEQLLRAVRTIDDFWLEIVKVSPASSRRST
jgi:chemotaxis family two-component system response regulator Rcp1